MRTHYVLLASLLAFGLLDTVNPSWAQSLPPGTVLEASVETSTEAVIFPSSADGRLQVRGCEGCAHATIALDHATQFILGGASVTLHELAQYSLRTPGHALTIHYRLNDLVASRVTVLVR